MKAFLFGNLYTKVLALFMAILTWGYLHAQGMGTEEIVVEFRPPELDPQIFASAVWMDSDQRPLLPGAPMRVRISGPKGDVRSHVLRPPMTFKCEPVPDLKTTADHGTINVSLQRTNFTIPGGDESPVTPLLSSPTLYLKYAKYRETTIELISDRFYFDGRPAEGYKIDSITVLPPRIRTKVPADLADTLTRCDIKRVPVHGRTTSILPTPWELDPAIQAQGVHALESFHVEVKIVPNPATHLIRGLPLLVLALPEVKARVELETKTVDIEVQGPQEAVDEAKKVESAFSPYVNVTERDLEPAGPKNLNEIGCHILDPRFRGKITVVVMPTEKPENRQIKVKILPK